MSSPSMMSAPSAMPMSSPAPPPMTMAPAIPKVALPRAATAAPKPPTRARGGAGPYMGCDPITGKCPPYR
jgi:hypothetical protein